MKKILIIEDDTELCANIKQIFELQSYKVFTARSGTEGINSTRKNKPDVILCDIRMPGMDGYSVKNTLGSDPATFPIPFIFLSAKSELHDVRYGLSLGADDYIIKPFSAADLYQTIENRLKRINELKSAPSSETLKSTPKDKRRKRLPGLEQLLVYIKGEPVIIKIADIVIINSDGDYSNVVCADGKKFVIRKLLKDWEKILPEKVFFRARKTSIINLKYIAKLEKWYSRTLLVKMENLSSPVIVSQRMSKLLKMKLGF
jgi:DNA-binding LytR/AlgR family response regulator